MRTESRPPARIWLLSCMGGLAAAVMSSLPFFICSYHMAGCSIWSAVYFITACIIGFILTVSNKVAPMRPDSLVLCMAMVLGAILTSLIAASPFFMCSLKVVGCVIWTLGFVGGFIYTGLVFEPPNGP